MKQQQILEEALEQIREIYTTRGNSRIDKIQQNVAIGMIRGMIAVQKASEYTCAAMVRYLKNTKTKAC